MFSILKVQSSFCWLLITQRTLFGIWDWKTSVIITLTLAVSYQVAVEITTTHTEVLYLKSVP